MKSAARSDGDLELAGFYDFLLKKVKLVEKRRRDEDLIVGGEWHLLC